MINRSAVATAVATAAVGSLVFTTSRFHSVAAVVVAVAAIFAAVVTVTVADTVSVVGKKVVCAADEDFGGF